MLGMLDPNSEVVSICPSSCEAPMLYVVPHKHSVVAITMKLAKTIGEDAAWRVAFKRARNAERYRRMMARRKR